jgi:hypothetical protein
MGGKERSKVTIAFNIFVTEIMKINIPVHEETPRKLQAIKNSEVNFHEIRSRGPSLNITEVAVRDSYSNNAMF